MFLEANAYLFERARELRKSTTPAEKVLWSRISGKQLGVKFRRQHPLHSYIADFYCHGKKLVIEVDGSTHDTDQRKFEDSIRTETLASHGIAIVRFRNDEVLLQTDHVVKIIKAAIDGR